MRLGRCDRACGLRLDKDWGCWRWRWRWLQHNPYQPHKTSLTDLQHREAYFRRMVVLPSDPPILSFGCLRRFWSYDSRCWSMADGYEDLYRTSAHLAAGVQHPARHVNSLNRLTHPDIALWCCVYLSDTLDPSTSSFVRLRQRVSLWSESMRIVKVRNEMRRVGSCWLMTLRSISPLTD